MKPLDLTSEILTRKEGAALLKMSQPTFDKLYTTGKLPVLKAGRLKRFRKSDVLALASVEREGDAE